MILSLCNAQVGDVMEWGSTSPSLWVSSTPGTPLLIFFPLMFVFSCVSTSVYLRIEVIMYLLLKRRNNFLRNLSSGSQPGNVKLNAQQRGCYVIEIL